MKNINKENLNNNKEKNIEIQKLIIKIIPKQIMLVLNKLYHLKEIDKSKKNKQGNLLRTKMGNIGFKKVNMKISNLFINKISIILLWNFIMINLIKPIISSEYFNERKLESGLSVSLKVIKNGKIKIINTDYLPQRVYVNGIKTTIDKSAYIIIEEEGINNVTIEWDAKKKPAKCAKMFQNIDCIIRVDFSDFDFSGITSMKSMFVSCENLKDVIFSENIDTFSLMEMTSMFDSCTALESLDLSSFNTSNVKYMDGMFKNCKKLTSLNLTNFITPKLTKIKEMFFGCEQLQNLTIPNIETSNINDMDSLFYKCASLISLDITNFNTQKVKIMSHMFEACRSLISLDLSNFDTTLVTTMNFMFSECNSLVSLNLSTFTTTNVREMNSMFMSCYALTSIELSTISITKATISSMFSGCTMLESLDLSHFYFANKNMEFFFASCSKLKYIKFSKEKKLVTSIDKMFSGCRAITSLDLSSFDFKLIKNMDYLFLGCELLTSIDFSNVDASSVTTMDHMFAGCSSLIIINLTNFNTSSVTLMGSMFTDCTSLISLDLSNFNSSKVVDMNRAFFNCIKLISINFKNFNTSQVINMESMFYACNSLETLDLSSFNTSSVIDMSNMFFGCRKLTSLDLSNFNTQKVEKIFAMFYDCVNLKYINFYNYYNRSILSHNDLFYGTDEYLIICIKNKSEENIKLKLSLDQCVINTCTFDIFEHHRNIIYNNKICLENCYDDEIYKYEFGSFCYEECPKGTHILKENSFLCEVNIYECNEDYPFLIIEDNICVDDCNCKDFFENLCTINNIKSKTQELMIKNIIEGIQEGILDDLIGKYIFSKKKDILKLENDTLYQITSDFNQKNDSENDNTISKIDLGQCKNILREKHSISKDNPLIIFKIEKYFEELLIPIIDFEIFNPKTKEKLDLDFCKNEIIDIYIPVDINESSLYKYEPNSSYYNDICYTYTNEYGIDMTLYDRKNEFNNNYMSLCSINCIFSQYDYKTKKVLCQCNKSKDIINISEINKTEILFRFPNEKNSMNLGILKCKKLLFSKKGLVNNIGSYIIILIILLYILSAIYFYLKGFDLLCNQINDILNKKEIAYDIESNSKNDIKEITTDYFSSKNNKLPNRINFNKSNIDTKLDSDISMKKNLYNNYKNNFIKKETEKIIDYAECELNKIPYQEALKNDKRTYLQFYISLIKSKHILIFTFYPSKDYNSYIIKICIFFLVYSSIIFVNALFFNDTAMHIIYEDKGKYYFFHFLPQMIYSILISFIFALLIYNLGLSQRNILEIKQETNRFNLKGKVLLVIRRIIIKIFCFFILSFILLILFWYYLSCFCVVYKNTQIFLIINALICYLMTLVYQFIFYLIPGLFRIPSLKGPGECLYKISQSIQLI